MAQAVSKETSSVNFDTIRAQFSVLDQEVNGQPLVYLDNAASSQMPTPVADRIDHYHRHEHTNVHRGIHSLSQQATDAYEASRLAIANFINARHQREVIFTTGTTDSINLVAQSYGGRFFEQGDHIILSELEHHANIVPWQMIAEKKGCTIDVIPVDDSGTILYDEYLNLLDEKVAMVAIGHVSNALGTVHPVKKMIADAHEYSIPVLADGAQAAPHMKVDVQDLDADFYAFSSHKMCGPTGFGILYGKETLLNDMPPYRGGGDMIDKVSFEETTYAGIPHKFEAGTPPIVAGIGTGAAVSYLQKIGMDAIARREHQLLMYATEALQSVEGLRIVGTATQKAAVISFVFDDIHAHDVGTILDKQGIAIRTGHHCAQPAMRRFNVPATARASMAFYNTEQDIDRLVEGLETVKAFF